jgi:hypothetical protein
MVNNLVKNTILVTVGLTGAIGIQELCGCIGRHRSHYSHPTHAQPAVESRVNASENYITKIREIGPDGRVYTSVKEFDSKRNLVREYKE